MSTDPDPKPWRCIDCADRFVSRRTRRHDLEWMPRARYSQSVTDYPAKNFLPVGRWA